MTDVPGKLEEIRGWAARHDGEIDELDGITVSIPGVSIPGASIPGVSIPGASSQGARWFNVRPSNTEPLLRLNVEAPDPETMASLRDEILALIRS